MAHSKVSCNSLECSIFLSISDLKHFFVCFSAFCYETYRVFFLSFYLARVSWCFLNLWLDIFSVENFSTIICLNSFSPIFSSTLLPFFNFSCPYVGPFFQEICQTFSPEFYFFLSSSALIYLYYGFVQFCLYLFSLCFVLVFLFSLTLFSRILICFSFYGFCLSSYITNF